jgi:kinetochore protein Spc7/SPC105
MNFNNPEEALSSSPYENSSPIRSDPVDVDGSSDESEDTAMSLDAGDATSQTVGSDSPGDSTSSSTRLDQALRQAAVHAGTQGIEFDENGDVSMELVEDEITTAFKPWVQRNKRDSLGLQRLAAMGEKENENPFSPALKAKAVSSLSEQIDPTADDAQEMSMDMTDAIGGIVKQNVSTARPTEQKGLKRRRSSTNFVNSANAEGSPAKRQSLSRRNSLRNRRSSGDVTAHVDESMDFTMVVGGIQPNGAKQEADKRHSIDNSLGEETMDFTMVVGGIKENEAQSSTKNLDEEVDANEDMSMELTTTLDKAIKVNASTTLTPKSPTKSPVKSPRTPTRPNSKTTSPAKPSTPLTNKTKTLTPQKPLRKSPRKSLAPTVSLDDSRSDALSASPPKLPTSKQTERFSERLIDLSSPQRSEEQATNRPNHNPSTRVASASPVAREKDPTNDLLKGSPEKAMSKTTSLSESIKLLSTPRKQVSASPTKRTIASSPKKPSTPNASTPKRIATPRKQVRLDSMIPDVDEEDALKLNDDQDEAAEELERISLQDFLNLTNIRFMDLTTTKRRHTGYPGASAAQLTTEDDEATVEEPNLENNVAVALAVLPMLSMYQHSCHEMKNYISGGREEIRSLEAQAYESQPPLFREYLSAPAEERSIMEGQFKNMKTNARLQSKAGWHAWRSQLLNDLKNGLEHSAGELEQDDTKITEQESILDDVLPRLIAADEQLSRQAEQLQRRAAEMDSVDREELEDVRSRLVSTEREIEEKKQLLAELQKQLEEKDATIEAAKESKVECAAQIKEAERVREECRGWSAAEVAAAKGETHPQPSKHLLTPSRKTRYSRGQLRLDTYRRLIRTGLSNSLLPLRPLPLLSSFCFLQSSRHRRTQRTYLTHLYWRPKPYQQSSSSPADNDKAFLSPTPPRSLALHHPKPNPNLRPPQNHCQRLERRIDSIRSSAVTRASLRDR